MEVLFQQLLPISQNLDGLNVSFDNRKMDQEWFSLKWNVGSGQTRWRGIKVTINWAKSLNTYLYVKYFGNGVL